jgi:hypothetical protein
MSGHKQLFKSTSKNGIFSMYWIIDQIHLRIPLKPSVRLEKGNKCVIKVKFLFLIWDL